MKRNNRRRLATAIAIATSTSTTTIRQSGNAAKIPAWASWTDIAPSSRTARSSTERQDHQHQHQHQHHRRAGATSSAPRRIELDRSKEDLWLRLQAFRCATNVVLDALRQSLNECSTIVRDTSTLLRHTGQKGFLLQAADGQQQYDDDEDNIIIVEDDTAAGAVPPPPPTTTNRTLPVLPSTSSSGWNKFLIAENEEPLFSTALPVLFIEGPLEGKDRELWMDHIGRELCRANDDGDDDIKKQQQLQRRQQQHPAEPAAVPESAKERHGNEPRRVIVFDTLEDLNEHRSVQREQHVEDKSAIYVVKTVRSARRFASCIQEMATTTTATMEKSAHLRTKCCLVVLRPPASVALLDEERWSADVYTKVCVLPPTERVIAAFWKRLSSVDFPLAVARQDDDHRDAATASSITATIDSVRRSIANILTHRGSFWAALPILPPSLIRRARSIHCPKRSIVHMLPAIGCLPDEWNETSKKVLIERLVHRYKALPREVQETAKDALYRSVLWLDRLQSRQQLVRLIFPHYDGDQAQPRRETVRALLDTSIGGQLTEGVAMDAYGMRHLTVCGMGRILKNGTYEKKAHVWCAGD